MAGLRVLLVESTWWWREALARLLENASHDFVPFPLPGCDPDQISHASLTGVNAAILSLDDRGEEMLLVLRKADIPCVVLGAESSSADLAIAVKTSSSYASKKDISPLDVIRLLEAAASGDAMILHASQRLLAETFESGRIGVLRRGADLTTRESQVLEGIGRGLTNREIAAELYLAPGSVKKIVSRCLQKLGVRNRTQAALRLPGGRPNPDRRVSGVR